MSEDGRSKHSIGNGWVQHTRPDGKRFYVNLDQDKRTWVRPEGEGILPEEGFDRCVTYDTRVIYKNGRYPEPELVDQNLGPNVHQPVTASSSKRGEDYDCAGWLERLYRMNAMTPPTTHKVDPTKQMTKYEDVAGSTLSLLTNGQAASEKMADASVALSASERARALDDARPMTGDGHKWRPTAYTGDGSGQFDIGAPWEKTPHAPWTKTGQAQGSTYKQQFTPESPQYKVDTFQAGSDAQRPLQ